MQSVQRGEGAGQGTFGKAVAVRTAGGWGAGDGPKARSGRKSFRWSSARMGGVSLRAQSQQKSSRRAGAEHREGSDPSLVPGRSVLAQHSTLTEKS